MPRQLEVFWMLLTGNRQFKTQYLLATAENRGTTLATIVAKFLTAQQFCGA